MREIKKRKPLLCLAGFHSLDKKSRCVPTMDGGEFSEDAYIGHYALGVCCNCGEAKMVQCFGSWQYTTSSMQTKAAWLKELLNESTTNK